MSPDTWEAVTALEDGKDRHSGAGVKSVFEVPVRPPRGDATRTVLYTSLGKAYCPVLFFLSLPAIRSLLINTRE